MTLIGEGPMHARLVCLAKNLINDESYRFLPPKPVAEILQIIRQDHTFVLPSNAVEGWGPVVNEAMGEGCTVIASEASGAAKSMICHRVNGYLFTPGDSDKLTELLCTLSSDDLLRTRLATAG